MNREKFYQSLLLTVPICAMLFFVYMSFFHAAYAHPGQEIYLYRCAPCHGDKGEGIQQLVPPLYRADFLKNNLQILPCLIRNGMHGRIVVNGKTYDQPMYPIELNEVEMTNLLNFLATEMADTTITYSTDGVSAQLKNCDISAKNGW